ncbi:MAG: hypothetical protein AAGF96_00955 [Bacteroidota bacterium]
MDNYCGTRISNTYAEPMELLTLTFIKAERKNPLLKDYHQTFKGFLWYKEACDQNPPRTVLLLTSEACPAVHVQSEAKRLRYTVSPLG